jgi:hypothetical protein
LEEGLREEFSGDSDGQGQSAEQGSVIFDGSPGEMAALGIRERTL